MTLRALPDLAAAASEGGVTVFPPYFSDGPHLVVPHEIVTRNAAGTSPLRVELVRGVTPEAGPPPYGVLELDLAAEYPIEAALEIARRGQPTATVAPLAFAGGWLSLRPAAGVDVPPEVTEPRPLDWYGLDGATWTLRLSTDGVSLVRRALDEDVVLLDARADLHYKGLARRLPITLEASPAQLLARLGEAEAVVTRASILQKAKDDVLSLVSLADGSLEGIDRDPLAERIVDIVATDLATPCPGPPDSDGEWVKLRPASSEGLPGRWDLSKPTDVVRQLTLHFDPLTIAREIARTEGIEAVVTETIVPELETGRERVGVRANLPKRAAGLLGAGVTIEIPARPPHRVQPVIESAELAPPEYRGELLLTLAPGEPLEYSYTTFSVVEAPGGIEQIDGPSRAGSGEEVFLTPADWPLIFVPVSASQSLLAAAEVTIACRRSPDETNAQLTSLGATEPSVTLVLPAATAQHATLTVEVKAPTGESLTLGPWAPEPLNLDLSSLPGHGSHTIKITCALAPGATYAIDIAPEDRFEDTSEVETLLFSADRQEREWTYVATSPFRPGYRVRPNPGGEWSEPRSPSESLVLQATEDA